MGKLRAKVKWLIQEHRAPSQSVPKGHAWCSNAYTSCMGGLVAVLASSALLGLSELAQSRDCILLLWCRGNSARTQLNVPSHWMPIGVMKVHELTYCCQYPRYTSVQSFFPPRRKPDWLGVFAPRKIHLIANILSVPKDSSQELSTAPAHRADNVLNQLFNMRGSPSPETGDKLLRHAICLH